MPVSPSVAEVRTQTTNTVDLLEIIRAAGESNADNFVDASNTLTQSLETDFASELESGVATLRSNLNAFLSNPRSVLDPIIRTWGRHVLDTAETDPLAIIDEMIVYFNDNSERVQSRDFTFGTPTFAGAVGSGTLFRLNTSALAFDLEEQHIDSKQAICIAAEGTGATRNRELFQIQSSSPGKDEVERDGSAIVDTISAQNSDDSLLENSGFDSLDIANAIITSWSSSITIDATGYAEDTTNIFQPAPDSNTTRKSLELKATGTLTQIFADVGVSTSKDSPYFAILHYNASVNTATGTLELHIGSNSVSVVVDGKTGWQQLVLALDENLWPENFDEAGLDAKIVWTQTGTGLLIDELVFVEMQQFDGSYYTMIGGVVSFLINDKATWADTATGSILQKWIWRGYSKSLPHTTVASLITIPDPT